MRTNLIVIGFVAFLSILGAYVVYSYPQDDEDMISKQQLDLQRAAFTQKEQETISRFTPVVTVSARQVSTEVGLSPVTTMSPIQVDIAIHNNRFEPENITIQKGTTVIWQNEDLSFHTIYSNALVASNSLPSLESSPMRSGDLFFYTFNRSGVYNYTGDAGTSGAFHGQIIVVE